ncbi:MAG: hypothetical protein AB7E31_03910 [Desulfitobacterium sp.]
MIKLELPTYKEWARTGWNSPNAAESLVRKPKDIDLQEGNDFKASSYPFFAKSFRRRKVGNRTFPTRYEAGADLAGDLSEPNA